MEEKEVTPMTLSIGPANPERTNDFEHNGWKFRFKANDPYGFITVYCLTNKKTLDGQFTGVADAEKYCKRYILTQNEKKA